MDAITILSTPLGAQTKTEFQDRVNDQETSGAKSTLVKTTSCHTNRKTPLVGWQAIQDTSPTCRPDLPGRNIARQNLNDELRLQIRRHDFSGSRKDSQLFDEGACLTQQELDDALLSALQRDVLDKYSYANLLARHGACLKKQDQQAFHDRMLPALCKTSTFECNQVELFMSLGISFTQQELHDALISAIQRDDLTGYFNAKFLISLGAALTQQELHDHLLSAINREYVFMDCSFADLLIELGATLTREELHDSLLMAIRRGDPPGYYNACLLIKLDATLHPQEGHDMLLSSIQRQDDCDYDIAVLLLDQGATLTPQELHDNLLSAIQRGGTYGGDFARLLVHHGAELTRQELDDNLISATERGDLDGAELLTSLGAKLPKQEEGSVGRQNARLISKTDNRLTELDPISRLRRFKLGQKSVRSQPSTGDK